MFKYVLEAQKKDDWFGEWFPIWNTDEEEILKAIDEVELHQDADEEEHKKWLIDKEEDNFRLVKCDEANYPYGYNLY